MRHSQRIAVWNFENSYRSQSSSFYGILRSLLSCADYAPLAPLVYNSIDSNPKSRITFVNKLLLNASRASCPEAVKQALELGASPSGSMLAEVAAEASKNFNPDIGLVNCNSLRCANLLIMAGADSSQIDPNHFIDPIKKFAATFEKKLLDSDLPKKCKRKKHSPTNI